MTARINGSTEAAVNEAQAPTLNERVAALQARRQAQTEAKRVDEEQEKVHRLETAMRVMPEAWRTSGLLDLLGPSVVVLNDAGAVEMGVVREVSGIEVRVRIFAEADSFGPNNWLGMEIRTPTGSWSQSYHISMSNGVCGDHSATVVNEICASVAKLAALRPRAAAVRQAALETLRAWQEWDDACRLTAGELTLRLWEPVEMWRLTAAAQEGEDATYVVLEAPQDVVVEARAASAVTVVSVFGDVKERWLFGIGSMERTSAMEPTIEKRLEYHRSHQVGRYWVNLPVTAAQSWPAERDLASHVLGAANPADRWEHLCAELGVRFDFVGWDDEYGTGDPGLYWPRALAALDVDEIVEAHAGRLGWETLRRELQE